MKLWVDDERPAPKGWSWRTTVKDALVGLCTMYDIEELSLDHDMGADQPTGYDLLYCMARLKLTVPVIHVHSMNPDGKQAMLNLIEQFELAR